MRDRMDVSIRFCADTDLPAILRIYNQAIENGVATWDEAPWTMAERQTWFAGHDASTPILVAQAADEVIGFAYLTFMSAKSGWRFTREDTVYVDPAWQGRGVGGMLLAALLEEARRIGVRLVVASITSTNVASLALHQKLGFEPVGTLKNAGFKFGEWRDTTYMQCDLMSMPSLPAAASQGSFKPAAGTR